MKARHWADMGESTFLAGIWLLYGIHRLLGRWPFRLCMYPVALAHWLMRPTVRASSLEYLRRLEETTGALGRPPRLRDGLRHIATFAETMLDKLLAVSGRYPFQNVRTEGREQFYAEAKAGRGGVIITAHMGCLELCRTMGTKRGELKLNILVHTAHARQFNRLLERLDPSAHFRLIEVSQLDPPTAIALDARVQAGEYIVIAGDRVPVNSQQTVNAEFLGRDAPFPVGPYVLAGLLKCPLYLLGCFHEGGGYTIHFERLAERIELPRGRREAAIAGYARQYADRLTELLRRSPFDWFNFFPFWDQVNVTAKPHA